MRSARASKPSTERQEGRSEILQPEPDVASARLEAQWIERAQRGDRDGFAALIDRHQDALRAFLYRLGVRGEDLDDATQEVFLAVIRSLPRFDGRSQFKTWLFGVAVHVARRMLGRNRAPRRVEEAPEKITLSDPSDPLVATELGERVRAQLLRLSAPLREAFVLRHVEGFSVAAAAALLQVPEGTLRRRAFEACDRLRELCSDFEAMR